MSYVLRKGAFHSRERLVPSVSSQRVNRDPSIHEVSTNSRCLSNLFVSQAAFLVMSTPLSISTKCVNYCRSSDSSKSCWRTIVRLET